MIRDTTTLLQYYMDTVRDENDLTGPLWIKLDYSNAIYTRYDDDEAVFALGGGRVILIYSVQPIGTHKTHFAFTRTLCLVNMVLNVHRNRTAY